jgi:hypothetical protein
MLTITRIKESYSDTNENKKRDIQLIKDQTVKLGLLLWKIWKSY